MFDGEIVLGDYVDPIGEVCVRFALAEHVREGDVVGVDRDWAVGDEFGVVLEGPDEALEFDFVGEATLRILSRMSGRSGRGMSRGCLA